MSRLRTKCFWASAATHGLLGLVLVAGSGFLAGRREAEGLPTLTFIPDKLVDALVTGGGQPAAPRSTQTPPTTAPPTVAPPSLPPAPRVQTQPPLPPAPAPEPKPATVEPPRARAPKPPAPKPPPEDEGKGFKEVKTKPATVTAPPKRKVEADLTPATRTAGPSAAERAKAEAKAERETREARVAWAKEVAEAQRARVDGALSSLAGGLSGSTVVTTPGTGGETYANYGLFVRSVYEWAWRPPEEVSDEAATVRTKVVIAREGRILSAEVVAKSGVAALDQSVRAALARVQTIGKPFPEGAAEDQRTFYINFNLKTRRGLG